MEQLYLDHHPMMYRAAVRVLRHPQDAEDVISDTFLSLCKKIPLLRSMDCNKLRAYLVISIRNTAINLLRRKSRQAELLWAQAEETPDAQALWQQEDGLFDAFEDSDIAPALRRLPLRDRQLIEMKYALGLSDEEMARQLEIKPVSVRVYLSRVRQKLRALMEERERDHDAP